MSGRVWAVGVVALIGFVLSVVGVVAIVNWVTGSRHAPAVTQQIQASPDDTPTPAPSLVSCGDGTYAQSQADCERARQQAVAQAAPEPTNTPVPPPPAVPTDVPVPRSPPVVPTDAPVPTPPPPSTGGARRSIQSEGSNPFRFNTGEEVFGAAIHFDPPYGYLNCDLQNCYIASAPGPGDVYGGVVWPWPDEVPGSGLNVITP